MINKIKGELENISKEQETVRDIQADLIGNQTVLQKMKQNNFLNGGEELKQLFRPNEKENQ